jgi:formyltetrahydrofolate-dependent phosphoribosylglycinamide formyltransferase
MSAKGTGRRRKKVVVLISGRGSNFRALYEATCDPDYPCAITAVLSDNPEAAGLEFAREAGLDALAFRRADFESREAHEDAVLEALEKLAPDLVCLAGYMRLLSSNFIEQWRGQILNIHPSLLPSFRGLDTHKRALAHQVRIHGCSVHFVTEGMDEGPIIGQAAVPVWPGDDEKTLSERVLRAEHRLYPAMLRLAAEGKVRMSNSGETVFSHLEPRQDGNVIMSPAG